MSELVRDLRHAVRALRRAPGFTAAAVLTLALGIGANTAIFSAVKGVLLQPLPYRDPGRLYLAMESSPTGGRRAASYPTFLDWEAQQDGFAALGYTRGRSELYRGPDGPESRGVAYVSPGFVEALGLPTVLGRPLAPDDARDGGRAVVLSHRWWRSGFGGDPAVVGKPVTLGGRSYAVVGVAAPAARYPDWADAWIPLAAIEGADPALTQRGLHVDSRVIVRLRPPMSPEQAQARLSTIAARLAAAYPAESEGWTGVTLLPLRTEVMEFSDSAETRLLVLSAAVVLVLLIACANVTNLLLARALTRGRELAVRLALGARRGRIAGQLLAESLVLAGGGGLVGALLAAWGVALVKRAAPDALPRLEEVHLDVGVLGFSAGLVIVTALLVGMAPALQSPAAHLMESLRSGAAGAGRAHHRVRQAIVTAQFALAVVLVVGAGLLTTSLWRLSRADPGFDPRGVLSIRVTPPPERYPDARSAGEFYHRILAAARALPGVQSAGLTNHVPLSGGWFPSRVVLPGESPSDDRRGDRSVFFRTVSPDYFATMRIPVRQGRPIGDSDLGGAEVAILNETAAGRFFPGGDAVGQTVTLFRSAQGRPDFGEPFAATIVGVVGDVLHTGLDVAPPAEVYVPFTANPWGHMALVIRVAEGGDPIALLPTLRRAILAVDPDVPVAGPAARTTAELVSSALAAQRLNTGLLAVFALTAVVLAAVGIYGVVAYTVAQRRRELGIRLALGARAADVRALVLRQGAGLAGGGAALGLAAALLGTRVLRGLLYEITPTDPATLIAGTLALVGVALLASYLPARRAARVAPMEVLRHD